MSKLLHEYDSAINALLTEANQDGMYVVARWHKHDKYSAVWRNHKLDEARTSQDTGVGLYVFSPRGHVAFGSTNDLGHNAVLGLYRSLALAAQTNEKLGIALASEIFMLERQDNLGEDATHYQHRPLLDYDLAQLSTVMKGLDDIVSDLNQKLNIEASFEASADLEQDQWRIVRSDGTDVDFSLPKVRLRRATVTVRSENGSAQNFQRLASTTIEGLVADAQKIRESFIRDSQESIEQLEAQAIEGGNPAVMMNSELMGMIAHEALGHPAESDIIASGGSVLGDDMNHYKVGLQVAEANVNVTDHEADLNHGFHPYGAFGNARQSVSIVKNGKLHESISDIFSASAVGVKNKNCERSEEYSSPAIPRMSNTYVHINNHETLPERGALTEAEEAQRTLRDQGIFKKYPQVLFMRGGSGGQVGVAAGTFMFGTRFVYEITADKITPKKPVSFSGDVLSALKSIRFAAGEVDATDFGFCGKAGQRADVNDGGNAFVFLEPNENLTVV